MAHETMQDGDMVEVLGGRFIMGSSQFYPEEAPAHERTVEAFAIDRTPVTNDEFSRFVRETGHVTVAERELDAHEFATLTAAERMPGSLVFVPTTGPVNLREWRQWWSWVPGADWRHPAGEASSIYRMERHPVVQIAYTDALAYAIWAGKRLPTEAEFEFAAKAGCGDSIYAWGSVRDPRDRIMANTWRGRFPYLSTGEDGWHRTSPVGSFPPNALGLVDMIGNVWEWTSDLFTPDHRRTASVEPPDRRAVQARTCCAPSASAIASDGAIACEGDDSTMARRVLKGGSHLCAPEYCLRYRPAARSPQAEDSATTHIGFRCVRSLD